MDKKTMTKQIYLGMVGVGTQKYKELIAFYPDLIMKSTMFDKIKQFMFKVNVDMNDEVNLDTNSPVFYGEKLLKKYHQEKDISYVTKSYAETYNLNVDELWSIAEKNTFDNQFYVFKDLNDVFIPIGSDREEEMEGKLYVVSSRAVVFGAACGLNPKLMKRLAKEEQVLVMLPSSTSEVLFIPMSYAEAEEKWEQMTQMVNEVNENNVEDNLWLGDQAYLIDVSELPADEVEEEGR